MPWPFYFHAAVDIVIMLGILYIFLCLFEVRRKIYPSDYPNNDDDGNDDSDSQDNEQTTRT
ncbi:MAG: hypothetical protein OXD46_15470 [Chloroflexi bacterium]|nr:hypothetical protein [Chloroflexota bacterium]